MIDIFARGGPSSYLGTYHQIDSYAIALMIFVRPGAYAYRCNSAYRCSSFVYSIQPLLGANIGACAMRNAKGA